MDNERNAPIIPAGTQTKGGVAYDPLVASIAMEDGQADNSPEEGQLAEGQQIGYGQAPQGTTYDELMAKKGFRTADDLAVAYANLESQNKKVEMSLADLLKAREEKQPEISVEPAVNPMDNQQEAIKVVENIVRKATRPLEDRLALQDLFHSKPDAQQYASDMAQLVKDNPGISWDVAYRAAKFNDLEIKAREIGKKEAYQEIQRKEQFSTGGGKATVKTQPIEELIRDKSIPFKEVQKIMKEKFSQ